MILAFAGLSFVHAQFIRAWVICMRQWHMEASTFKLFWQYPSLTAARHQRALWIASIGSIWMFLISLGFTILACAHYNLQTPIMTVRTLELNHPRKLLKCLIASNRPYRAQEDGRVILPSSNSTKQHECVALARSLSTII